MFRVSTSCRVRGVALDLLGHNQRVIVSSPCHTQSINHSKASCTAFNSRHRFAASGSKPLRAHRVHTAHRPEAQNIAKDKVRMLVLETDEPHPDTASERGSFGDIFSELFKIAGEQHDPPLEIDTDMHYIVDDPENNHHGRVPKASDIPTDITAILISGSMYDAHGNDRWIQSLLSLLKELWQTRPEMKFSGVCFGHQLLCRLLGSKVEQHPGEQWELSHTEMKLSPVGQSLFRTEHKTLALPQMHQDHVTSLPSHSSSDGLVQEGTNVHIWASTSHTKIQGVYIRDRLFTSQGHLGFDEAMVRRQIRLRRKSGGIDEDDIKELRYADQTAHLKHDGKIVAGAILRFFHGDDQDIN